MNRSLNRRIRRLEHRAAEGRVAGYILAQQVRDACGRLLPNDQWIFIRNHRHVPYESATRAARRILTQLLDKPLPVTHGCWWLVDDILWYLDNRPYWRPRHGWDGLWQLHHFILPRLPDGPGEVATHIRRDIETALNTHDPDKAEPFRPARVPRRPEPPPPTAKEADFLAPSLRSGADHREHPTFFEEEPEPPWKDPWETFDLAVGIHPSQQQRQPAPGDKVVVMPPTREPPPPGGDPPPAA